MNSLGLTSTEQKIFTEILARGEISLGEIIKHLGLHKGTVYNSIRRLQAKGFVAFSEGANCKIYSINRLALKNLLDSEQKKHNETVKNIQELLRTTAQIKQDSATVQVLTGTEGFKTFFNDLYRWGANTKKEYLFMGKGNEMIDYLGMNYYKKTQIIKKKLGVQCRVILNETSRIQPVSKYVVGNVRYMKMDYKSPESTWIYDSKVVIVLWDSKPIYTIIISSDGLVKSYTSYFERMWLDSEGAIIKLESFHKVNVSEHVEKMQKSFEVCGINCLIPVHEGRANIIRLLTENGKARILMADPKGKTFKTRIRLEERNIKSMSKSRILYEWKSVIANLKDIQTITGKKIEIRTYKEPIDRRIMIIDDNKFFYSEYSNTPAKYGSSEPHLFIDKSLNQKGALAIRKRFEELWKKATPLQI
ncbi:MarR family transcriptional regulator [Candidatus Woesearchaeota archaeon]|nr:MarR family transcriptional regulator [Candidatus Woesearchaeota archaeon]